MPHHKSSKKRMVTSEKAAQRNKQMKSRIKTSMKHVISAKDKEAANAALNVAYSVLDKAAKTNIIHKNKAANQKALLTRAIQKIGSQQQ